MKCIFTLFLACISTITIHAQNKPIDSLSNDNRYREDQFYFAVTYNLLNNRPKGVSQTGLSNGFHFGFIRDFPLNQRRNMAIGLGLGASINNYNHNIFVYENDAGEIEYINLSDSDIDYSKNKFSTYLLEIPLEFRWRTSTAEEYKFWRIYSGFKMGYLLASSTKFKGDGGTVKNNNLKDFNNLQYGLTLSAGYNTWNFHVFYSLNSIFSNDAKIGSEAIDMSAIKFGLIFYIL